MLVSYFDDSRITENALIRARKKLGTYRTTIENAAAANDHSLPEASLYYARDFGLHDTIESVTKKYRGVNHVVLLGIGGSSLGVEAVHQALGSKGVRLSVVDTLAPYRLAEIVDELLRLKNIKKVVFFVVSKSGTTTETLANASALINSLKPKFGDSVFEQMICISDAGTPLEKFAKKNGSIFIAIPHAIGGRFSIATAAGLVPLALLGHDVDEFIDGYLAVENDDYEMLVTESAARLSVYRTLGKYQHYNFFAFDTRLTGVAFWYRQLLAESLGKASTRGGKKTVANMIPAVSTPAELHSTGQHYMSGISAVYTDFLSFEDDTIDIRVGKGTLAPHLAKKTLGDLATALYGGVLGAYRERTLPYRSTIFDGSLTYSLGLFMAMRIKEIMYVALIEDLNAFDQPNVELYKQKMRELL